MAVQSALKVSVNVGLEELSHVSNWAVGTLEATWFRGRSFGRQQATLSRVKKWADGKTRFHIERWQRGVNAAKKANQVD